MKGILVILFVCVLIKSMNCAMSEAQLKAAVKLVRNVCQPKTKATSASIDGMHKGNWDIEQITKCYMYCSLNMYKLMAKDNTFNYEEGMSQTEKTVPEARKAPTRVSMNNCRYSAKTLNDKCAAAYEIAKCIYEDNPGNYFLP